MPGLLDLVHSMLGVPPPPPTPAPPKPPVYMAPGKVSGLVESGNTDLTQLPVIDNKDGTYSTVYSSNFTDENPKSRTYGKEVLVKGIVNGKKTDDINAIKDQYYRTGQHLGVFSNSKDADAYGEKLHEDWAAGNIPGVKMIPRMPQ